MRPEFCARCRPQDPQKSQPGSSEPSRAKAGTLDQQYRELLAERRRAQVVVRKDARAALETGYVRICTQGGGRRHHSFNDLDVRTRVVHINGYPFLWAIELILERAPNVSRIEVIPSMLAKLQAMQSSRALALCRERAVELVAGHDRPDTAWEGKENRSPTYDKQRAFLVGLAGTQKARWEELLAMEFEAAQLTARYFCLRGEEYRSQRILGEDYGIAQSMDHMVSMRITAILYYLDPSFKISARSKQFAGMMERRAARLRPFLTDARLREKLATQLGIPALPSGLPLSRLEVYDALLQARQDGRLDRLAKDHENAHCALALRFGLDKLDAPAYLTLEAVGQLMGEGGVTRERIRQLEERALELLGIQEDE